MADTKKYPGKLVFGLDIGTRSIIGIVGYKSGDKFFVIAHEMKEHETRAMLDGQIHDIAAVGSTIKTVKLLLEDKVGQKIPDACIAAAGRVLRTITVSAELPFETEKVMTREDIYALESLCVEKAYEEFGKQDAIEEKYYCVGYSVIRYYLNGHQMGNLENHKARKIGADIIATFLPDEVVDGLYRATTLADLDVANMTLEPIAAIQLAIPTMYRMLNIALVDVGAGTSDISITKDGSIVAYGMLPIAGDSLTEELARYCLVDFVTADHIKRAVKIQEEVSYKDIMGITQTISRETVLSVLAPVIDTMTGQVADKLKELNADKAVSAVFVVGGGGMIDGYTEKLAEHLGISPDRVGLRGEEVMQKIIFSDESVEKDSTLVTPIGICLNYFEQSNNFIYVSFNGARVKIYDNNKLAVVDAAIQAEFPNDKLFPKRGPELGFTVNGEMRTARGKLGEAAVIMVNSDNSDIYAPIHANDVISVTESTAGEAGSMVISALPEFGSSISVIADGKKVLLPKFVMVNGSMQSGYYAVQNGDVIEIADYYKVSQVLEFMDLVAEPGLRFFVNSQVADLETKVYDNFTVSWTVSRGVADLPEEPREKDEDEWDGGAEEPFYKEAGTGEGDTADAGGQKTGSGEGDTANAGGQKTKTGGAEDVLTPRAGLDRNVLVIVNNMPVRLKGKVSYVFVDVFDYIDFDLSKPQGKMLMTHLNGQPAQYMQPLNQGDRLDIRWTN